MVSVFVAAAGAEGKLAGRKMESIVTTGAGRFKTIQIGLPIAGGKMESVVTTGAGSFKSIQLGLQIADAVVITLCIETILPSLKCRIMFRLSDVAEVNELLDNLGKILTSRINEPVLSGTQHVNPSAIGTELTYVHGGLRKFLGQKAKILLLQ